MRLMLDPNKDQFVFETDRGHYVEVDVSPEQMVEISKWAFTRKVVHIILGNRVVDPNEAIRA